MSASPQDTDGPLSPTTSNGVASGATVSPRKPGISNDKKRKAGTSSRGVANLTPEQLAKKRANDREAQRAIRERTKNQIEALERRIRELTSQQPYQELQNILRQKELVELENAEIKRRLTAVLDLIQPIIANNVLADVQRSSVEAILNHSPADGYAHPVGGIHTENPVSGLGIGRANTAKSSPPGWPVSTSHASPTEDSPVTRPSPVVQKSSSFNSGMSDLLRTTSDERRELGLHHGRPPEVLRPSNQMDQHVLSPASLPADHHITMTSPISHHPSQLSQHDRDCRKPWQAVPTWSGATGVFDNLLLEFTLDAQRRRAQGASEFEIIGPAYPNFMAITYPSHDIPCHQMSRFLRDILTPFPDVTIIANKVAIAYIMFLILRWHISPTPETFERLPHWCRPNSWQLTMPHAIWIDHVPWPDMRTEMVRNPHQYPFDRFFVPHTKTESINWDHGEAAMYAVGDNADGDKVLSQTYETHIRNIDNWTLGPAFAKEFPILAAACRITTRGEDERRKLAEILKAQGRQRVG